ncbi:MAG: hypothetical protein PHX79_05735, partial [Sphaerochaetaceae bacterium]|nr:hypothetical protein [Sphaerochaetaceae bacterium]
MASGYIGDLLIVDGGGGGNTPTYIQIGTDVDNGYIKFGLRGTLNPYTMFRNNAPSGGESKYKFSASELSLYITRGSNFSSSDSTPVYIKKIRIYYENTLVRTMKCHAGDVFWQSWDFISLRNDNFNLYRTSFTIPFNDYHKHFGGNPYADTWPESVSPKTLTSSGPYSIYVEVDYEVSGSAYPGAHTERRQVGRITV